MADQVAPARPFVHVLACASALPTAVLAAPIDPGRPVVAHNDAFSALIGLDPSEPPPVPADLIVEWGEGAPGAAQPGPPEGWGLPDDEPARAHVVVRRRDGTLLPVQAAAAPVHTEEGDWIVVHLVDRRPLLAVEAVRDELEERFRQTFEHAPVGMAVGRPDLVITSVNEALCRFLDRNCADLEGRSFADLVHPDDRAVELGRLRQAVRDGESEYRRRTRHLVPDGRTVWGDLTLAVIHGADGRPHQFVAHLVDATDAQRRESELHQHSREDPLTRLLNRRALFEAYAELQSASDRRGAHGMVGVLFCDLDRFKEVNDNAGHHVGDELLRLVARRLHHTVRPDDRLARLGGDEFVLLCRVVEPADALAFARRVVRCFDEPFQVGGGSYRLAVSVGVAVAAFGADPDRHLAAADSAMYAAKRGGDAIALAADWAEGSTGRANDDRTDTTIVLSADIPTSEEPPMAPQTPPPGHDSTTGTDPGAKYDQPGYEDKSIGQAVNEDAELVDELLDESGGDLEAAERRFEQESSGSPALARQGARGGGSGMEEADRRNGEPDAAD